MNTSLFDRTLRERDLTRGEIEEKLGLSSELFQKKLLEIDQNEFTLGELRAMKRLLGLGPEQAERVFFV